MPSLLLFLLCCAPLPALSASAPRSAQSVSFATIPGDPLAPLLSADDDGQTSASRSGLDAGALPPAPAGLMNLPYGPTVYTFTGEASDATAGTRYPDGSPDAGPMLPIFSDDIPVDVGVTFSAQLPVPNPNNNNPVPAFVVGQEGCNPLLNKATAWCKGNLSQCLGFSVLAASTKKACACYLAHGACWRAAGCFDSLPQDDVALCFHGLMCTRDTCEGSGSSSQGVAVAAAAFAVFCVALLAMWQG